MKIQLPMICSRRSWVEVEVVTSFVSHSRQVRKRYALLLTIRGDKKSISVILRNLVDKKIG